MKRHGVINSHIASVLASMGHMDTIAIADAGLPVPDQVQRIDLALRKGTPSFIEVLKEVFDDMVVEQAILAKEIVEYNPNVLKAIHEIIPSDLIVYLDTHQKFKNQVASTKAVIRTGEVTPYANIILMSGVFF